MTLKAQICRFPSTFKARMVLVTTGLFASLLLLFGWGALERMHQSQHVVSDYQVALTQRVVQELDNQLETASRMLQAVASQAPVPQDARGQQAWLDQRISIRAAFFDQGLCIMNAQGRLVASTGIAPSVMQSGELGRWLQRAMTLEEPVLSLPFWAEVRGLRQPILILAVPVYDAQGKLAGRWRGRRICSAMACSGA